MFTWQLIAILSLTLGIISSFVILVDIIRHPQKMKIMNVVWPINGLFFGPFAIWAYYKWGLLKAKDLEYEDNRGEHAKVFMSTSHCSAGCTLGDAVGVPIVALTGFALFGSLLYGHFIVEFLLAFAFGILFQFYALYPMQKEQGKWHSIKEALKADTFSLIAFEVGMFGWMAVVHFALFTEPPKPDSAMYWFMMQIAMILGFGTSYPANWILVRKGIKEAM
ncbi:DUF4396 domain-containing protein [Alkalihalobacillus sp. R86527]|uniref:DUF4396 domain-containing protein n=1 Tax=Alkalihalobacillus sp. R86527 TaxID=3093863 RepID=UPI0036733342